MFCTHPTLFHKRKYTKICRESRAPVNSTLAKTIRITEYHTTPIAASARLPSLDSQKLHLHHYHHGPKPCRFNIARHAKLHRIARTSVARWSSELAMSWGIVNCVSVVYPL